MANPIKKCVLHGAVNNETVDLYPRTNLASINDMTPFARTLNGAADAATARNTLGVKDYTHPNSGVTAGTYREVTVNAQGHVIKGTNPILDISEGGTGASTVPAAIQALFGNTGIGTSKIPLYYDGTGFKACADAIGTGGIVASSLNENGWVKFSNGLVVQWGNTNDISFYGSSYATPANFSTQTIILPIALSAIFYINVNYKTVSGSINNSVTNYTQAIDGTSVKVNHVRQQDGGGQTVVRPFYLIMGII